MRQILAVLAAFLVAGLGNLAFAHTECFEGVPVKGSYIPVLENYNPQATQRAYVDDKPRIFNAGFLNHALIKEKGIALSGEAIIFQEGEWSVDDYPLTDEDKTWFPSEKDYVTTRKIITIEDRTIREYPVAFLREVITEGWGHIGKGHYLGKPWDCHPADTSEGYLSAECNGKWHFSRMPLDADGKRPERGGITTDKKYFDPQHPWKVSISPRPVGFLNDMFEVRNVRDDSGVNIFCGLGIGGLKCSINVTNKSSKVCFTRAAQD